MVELPFAPPDVRTRHVVEFLQDRLIVCGGGESWQGPFHASCYQVFHPLSPSMHPAIRFFTLSIHFCLNLSISAESKLLWMDCVRARGSVPGCERQQWGGDDHYNNDDDDRDKDDDDDRD